MNIQNQGSTLSKKMGSSKISNAEQQMSSSLLSEKLDKRHVVNLSTGNQKNIKVSQFQILCNVKFKNKFGEPQQEPGQTKHMNTSHSP